MTLHLNPHGPHSDDYTRQVAAGLAECVRVLNHATYQQAAASMPSTVNEVLGNVRVALAGLPQLLRQLGDRLDEMAADDHMYDDRDHDNTELTLQTVAAVREHLAAGRVAAAHREAGHLGLREGEVRHG